MSDGAMCRYSRKLRWAKDLIRNCSSACAWELRGKVWIVVVGIWVDVVGTGSGGRAAVTVLSKEQVGFVS